MDCSTCCSHLPFQSTTALSFTPASSLSWTNPKCINSLSRIIITIERSIKVWQHIPFICSLLSLLLYNSSIIIPHLILNQLCWLVLTLYFSYFTGSCCSRSPEGLENRERVEGQWREVERDLENEKVKSRCIRCVCVAWKCVEGGKTKRKSKWVWYWVIMVCGICLRELGWRKWRVQKIALVVGFFPLGVNDSNINQALWHFHFTTVLSAEMFPLEKILKSVSGWEGGKEEEGLPPILNSPPPPLFPLASPFLPTLCIGFF